MIEAFPFEYDVCRICETMFKTLQLPLCEFCRYVHRLDEWCAGMLPIADLIPMSHGANTVRGFAAFAHEAMMDLAIGASRDTKAWAWATREGACPVVGIVADASTGTIRFWVRDLNRCDAGPSESERSALLRRMTKFAPVWAALVIIAPPQPHT